ncbi:MAG: CPBP family intramembrane glutamic endopeptidase, partial [Chloroflexota bacterium]
MAVPMQSERRTPFNWLLYVGLVLAGLAGVAALVMAQLPQLVTLPDLPPLPVVIALSLVQSGVMLGVMVAVGLILARQIGLNATPLLTGNSEDITWGKALLWAVPSGLIAGAIVLLLDAVIFAPLVDVPISALEGSLLLWRIAAAFLYGGITEELIMRLFLMTLVVWLLRFIWRDANGAPTSGAYWTAIAITAVLFGLGHLPATVQLVPLTPV